MLQIPEEELRKVGEMGWGAMEYFYDRQTNTIVSEMNFEDYGMDWDDDDGDHIKEGREKSKEYHENDERYLQIHAPSSKESFRVMAKFVAQLPEDKYKYKMEATLEGHKPFRNFKNQVDSSPYREAWFAYKDQRERDYVREYLEMSLEEE